MPPACPGTSPSSSDRQTASASTSRLYAPLPLLLCTCKITSTHGRFPVRPCCGGLCMAIRRAYAPACRPIGALEATPSSLPIHSECGNLASCARFICTLPEPHEYRRAWGQGNFPHHSWRTVLGMSCCGRYAGRAEDDCGIHGEPAARGAGRAAHGPPAQRGGLCAGDGVAHHAAARDAVLAAPEATGGAAQRSMTSSRTESARGGCCCL